MIAQLTFMPKTNSPSDVAPKSISQSHFLVVGVVRNCETSVKKDVMRLQQALIDAKSVQWLLIESDSSDLTLDCLDSLKKETQFFDYLSLDNLRSTMPFRTQRIAHCRNIYLEQIRSNPLYAKVDYVIVSDFDNMNTMLSTESIQSCWSRTDWDICTANQVGSYYDLWALRHPTWSPNDCFDQYRLLIKKGMPAFLAYYRAIYSRMIDIPLDADWIEVDSAFGGLAIYKKAAILSSNYVGLTESGKEICEHVLFHQNMKQAGNKIFINPRLINAKCSEHVLNNFLTMVTLFFLGEVGLTRLKKWKAHFKKG